MRHGPWHATPQHHAFRTRLQCITIYMLLEFGAAQVALGSEPAGLGSHQQIKVPTRKKNHM